MIGFIIAIATSVTSLQADSWVKNQIQEELDPFKQGIKHEHVEKSFKNIQRTFDGDTVPIILVKVSDGKSTWEYPEKLEKGYFSRA
ncbi:MAG: hypothetical protein KDK44_04590, partial [Chlamydiia bacterium]|nr:hypothetical protein [Chlamydiia bacterium]